jgi:hypothetical protein
VTLQQCSCGPEQAVASSAPIPILRRLSRPPGHGMDPRVKPEDDEVADDTARERNACVKQTPSPAR